MQTFNIGPRTRVHPLLGAETEPPTEMIAANEIKTHPTQSPIEDEQASIPDAKCGIVRFVGTATTVIEYAGARLITDPNFLHAGDHVHLGPG